MIGRHHPATQPPTRPHQPVQHSPASQAFQRHQPHPLDPLPLLTSPSPHRSHSLNALLGIGHPFVSVFLPASPSDRPFLSSPPSASSSAAAVRLVGNLSMDVRSSVDQSLLGPPPPALSHLLGHPSNAVLVVDGDSDAGDGLITSRADRWLLHHRCSRVRVGQCGVGGEDGGAGCARGPECGEDHLRSRR